jgi:hypothetical protein
MGPILYSFDQTMFDGVAMYVIRMALEVGFVTDEVLPIAPLPKANLTALIARGALGFGDQKS